MEAFRPVLFLLLIFAVSSASDPIDSCTAISVPGEYHLSKDLVDREASSLPSRCLLISASDVILDCQGHSLVSTSPTEYAVLASGSVGRLSGVVVKNCVVKGYQNGIVFLGVDEGSISNNVLQEGGLEGAGVGLNDSTGIVVANNSEKGRGFGFSLIDSTGNLVEGNTAADNSGVGIQVSRGGGNELRNNTAFGNKLNGGFSISSDSTVLDSNTAYENTIGFHIESCNGVVVNNSRAYLNEDGIIFFLSNSGEIQNSHSQNNSGYGIHISNADDAVLSSTYSCDNYIDYSADSNLNITLIDFTCDSDILHRCNRSCSNSTSMCGVPFILLLLLLVRYSGMVSQ